MKAKKTIRIKLGIRKFRSSKSPEKLRIYVDSSSSSPIVLLANSNARRATPCSKKVNRPCLNFNKGSCHFSEHCKFLHNGVHGNPSLWSNSAPRSNGLSSNNLTQMDMVTLQTLLAKPNGDEVLNIASHANNLSVPNSTVNNSPMALHAVANGLSPNYCYIPYDAFNDPNWQNAMSDEYNTLIKNDGTLSRYKARLVANGSSQVKGIDVDETFSPVVKPGIIRTVLILAISRHWPVHQLDRKYAVEILERAHMLNCNPSQTLVDTESKLGDDGDPVFDLTLYRSLAGSLQYLTFTRPYIFYVVQQVCLYMDDPREPQFSSLKWILRYVCGTLDHGLQLFSSSTTSLVAYSDADWAGCPTTRRSASGYYVFLGNNLLSWSSKRQSTLSRSSADAEYRGVANAVAETYWLGIYYHQCTKHIEIDIHFVQDLVATGEVWVLHVPS
nr:ribonuclease H-like domain-containing protein [Tanacetum cinerariifolium]